MYGHIGLVQNVIAHHWIIQRVVLRQDGQSGHQSLFNVPIELLVLLHYRSVQQLQCYQLLLGSVLAGLSFDDGLDLLDDKLLDLGRNPFFLLYFRVDVLSDQIGFLLKLLTCGGLQHGFNVLLHQVLVNLSIHGFFWSSTPWGAIFSRCFLHISNFANFYVLFKIYILILKEPFRYKIKLKFITT